MKKSLFFYAAAALALTACSSEDDILQTGQTKQAAPQEVGFDVYTPAATNVTRAGLEGTMTTGRLQRSEYEGGGFGVYAFQVQDQVADAGDGTKASSYLANGASSSTNYRTSPIAPNFMVNEKLLWNSTNMGWYYTPLKYWPNETDNDSQTSPAEMLGDNTNNHIDRLTFFAYAPYVSEGKKATTDKGILFLTAKDGSLNTKSDRTGTSYDSDVREPSILYRAALDDPNEAVDLLWGVAPAGGIEYTAVNGKTVTVKEGEPLMDMTKPNVNTSMKFLFQHALARIGVTAVAAIDQVGAGGTLDPNTKITIEKITLTGYFGEEGILNLDNVQANVANWRNANGIDLKTATFPTSTPAATDLKPTTLTLVADHTSGTEADNHQLGTIARHLQFVGTPATKTYDPSNTPVAQANRVGVTTVRQNVIQPAVINNTLGKNRNWYTMKSYGANELAYSESTPYYSNADCTTLYSATVTAPVYTIDDKGVFTQYNSDQTLTYPQVNNYYNVTFRKCGTGGYYTDLTKVKGKQAYVVSAGKLTPRPVGQDPQDGDYVIVGDITKAEAKYATEGDYYKRDNNYFMVVPTNNFTQVGNSVLNAKEKELRTVRVMIEYYITTEDSKLADGRAQTKNVIEKDVVFPSIANGKSYNLNLVLGLTSVKMEAEVDDWKVVNVQADLPQNTAD